MCGSSKIILLQDSCINSYPIPEIEENLNLALISFIGRKTSPSFIGPVISVKKIPQQLELFKAEL